MREFVGLMILYLFVVLLEYKAGMFNLGTTTALMLTGAVTTVQIAMTSSSRNEYFYMVGIDGAMILQWLALLLIA